MRKSTRQKRKSTTLTIDGRKHVCKLGKTRNKDGSFSLGRCELATKAGKASKKTSTVKKKRRTA